MPKDNFSKQSNLYARYRPHYPKALFEFLYSKIERFDTAWDCATGNGQVASVLAEKFNAVYATDISQKQLSHAKELPNVIYKVGSAEASGLSEKVDLITVAQAIHWFDIEGFISEARKLSHKNTHLAFWGYGLFHVNSSIDKLIFDFYDNKVGPYWDPERKLIEDKYRDIEVPLKNVLNKDFRYEDIWPLATLEGYLSSWSAVQHYMSKHNHNPVPDFIESIASLWGKNQKVVFPIFLKAGILK